MSTIPDRLDLACYRCRSSVEPSRDSDAEAMDSTASSSVEVVARFGSDPQREGSHEQGRISAASTRSRGTRIRREPTDRKAAMPFNNTPRVPADGAPREELIKWGYDSLKDLVGSAEKKGDDAATDE